MSGCLGDNEEQRISFPECASAWHLAFFDLSSDSFSSWDGKVEFTFDNPKPIPARLNIRVPGWFRNSVMPSSLYNYVQNDNKSVRLKINGEIQEINIDHGYLTIEKQNWSSNDIIEVEFEMSIKKVISNAKVLSSSVVNNGFKNVTGGTDSHIVW